MLNIQNNNLHMGQSKFSIADLFTVLATLVFGTLCFLGFNFLTLGDANTSLIWAILISLILCGLAYGLKRLKSTSRNYKVSMIFEWIFLFLFTIVAYISFFPFSHYFVVNAQKENIKNEILSNLAEAENIYKRYESYADDRVNIYGFYLSNAIKDKLQQVSSSDFDKYAFNDNQDYNTQVQRKLFSLKKLLYPNNYQQIKNISLSWLVDAKMQTISWSPTGVVKVANTFESERSKWCNQLNQFALNRALGENNPIAFSCPPPNGKTPIMFTQQSSPNFIGIISGLGIFILMIFSYVITKRHPRYPGLKVIFKLGNIKENEL
jgi:hypothetical protein